MYYWDVLDKKPLKFNWACGSEALSEDYIGIDIFKHPAVTIQADILKPLKLPDNCVDESCCLNFLEHLTPRELIDFLNELWRVHKDKTTIAFRVPYFDPKIESAWMASFSDPTHVSVFTYETPTYFDINHFRWHDFAKGYYGNRSSGIPPFKLMKRLIVGQRFLDFYLMVIKEQK